MKILLLLGIIAQLLPGLWFNDKSVKYSGLTEGDAITFSIPVTRLPAGTYVQFGVTLENLADKAPRHYMVEVKQGNKWVCISSPVYNDGLSDYSFTTALSADRHPSTYLEVFRLGMTVKDSLHVRCRVCSNYAADRSILSPDDPDNCVAVKEKHYVGARLAVLGKNNPNAGKKKVLMLGNSFTYYYGVPFILQEIAFSQGLLLDINASLKGGQSFRDHTRLATSLTNCSLLQYDYAFLQGQSQEPGRYATDMTASRDVRMAYCDLCDIIRSISPECSIYVENTWAYDHGDCGGFGSMENFDRMLQEGTKLLARAGRSGIIPVGQAFAAVREGDSGIDLLGSDHKHQSLAGSYLKACVEYLLLSGKPFHGEVPSCGLDEKDAEYLRTIAEKIILNQ